jgi:uncharacterized membrane protein
LLVWLYFAEGAVRAASDRGVSARLALVEVLLCLVLFAACVMHVRLRLKKAAHESARHPRCRASWAPPMC